MRLLRRRFPRRGVPRKCIGAELEGSTVMNGAYAVELPGQNRLIPLPAAKGSGPVNFGRVVASLFTSETVNLRVIIFTDATGAKRVDSTVHCTTCVRTELPVVPGDGSILVFVPPTVLATVLVEYETP